MMEVSLVLSGTPEEETAEAYDINYEVSDEVERCGICMDGIVDRGVLDCCQHWFCFVCIDNWATITNLCPLCQKEFQLITCVPVYDTIGSNKVEEESFSRNDDWCFEGKSNISFPSYYIDENAVICLDGDGCKIRNGSGFPEGESDLDTSIACDSCDTWYHAFCVDFDPEDTSESTWLCPRCGVNDQENSINDSVPKFNSDFDSMNVLVAQSFSRKVSVSVADTGETALVVSVIGGNQVNEEQTDNTPSTDEIENDHKIENFILASEAGRPNVSASPLENTSVLPAPSMENTSLVPALGDEELELSLSHDTSISLPHDSLTHVGLKTSCTVEIKTEPCSLESIRNSSNISHPINKMSKDEFSMGLHLGLPVKTSCADEIKTESSSLESIRSSSNISHPINKMSKDEFSMGLHLGLPVGTFLSVDYSNDENDDQSVDVKQQLFPSEDHLSQADNVSTQTIQEASVIIGVKRKRTDCSDHIQKTVDNGDDKANSDTKLVQGKNQPVPSKSYANQTNRDDTAKSLAMPLVPREASLKRISRKKDVNADIMSIVRSRNRKPPPKSVACSNSNDEDDQGENLTGLRVKKIMRRAGEDQESSMLVQKLRNEIREAVRNKCAKEFGENLLDSKLLDAFRAAISGPKTETQKRLSALAVKAKKSLLQKGKIREGLTKKIYGATNGRRKRAWDRECEIEFWKHRCIRVRKPEKIATLKSVLDLLRNGSQSQDTEHDSECQPSNPILSRLYVADTSVFPRNNDIKPLSALKSSSSLEQKKDPLTGTNKVSSKAGIPLAANTGNNCSVSASKSAAGSGKGNHSGNLEASVGSKLRPQNTVSSTSNKAVDKRKWALEVLARKTGDGCSVANKKEEDMAVLKGKYPLLAQLPIDMRPELAPSRHNKIPLSVRQAQLYRLTEQFLKKTNLTVMRRTAETELAIADAVNIEKAVADRSNSKVVYLNLCSQEILHHTRTDTGRLNTAADLDSSSQAKDPMDESELATDPETDPEVEEALRNAGLLSDSPVNSPPHGTDVNDDGDDSMKELQDDEPENVIEMDGHPDLDIYGDFEYDLEEESCFTTKATKVLKPPDEGEAKLKVILSTTLSTDAEKSESLGSVELPKDASCSSKNEIDVEVGTAPSEDEKEGSVAVPLNSNEVEEPSLAEYEELYGPDTDPQIKNLPGEVPTDKPCVSISEFGSEQKDSCNDTNSVPIQGGKESDLKCEERVKGAVATTICSNPPADDNKQSDSNNSVAKKVETYIKEHVRPLCKSGVITAEQYRWAVQKTTEKVMKYHSKDKNANFLIKEGEKVKKLAEQYVEAAQRKGID